MRSVILIFGVILLLVIAVLALYPTVIRPWHIHWGAREAEVQAALPGDEMVNGQADQTTRAITIHTDPGHIWPWLLQLGQGRGGLYSYDWLENLAGCDIHTLDDIVPDLQGLKVGDVIRLGPQTGLPYYRVVLLETERALVLRSIDPATGSAGETWGFYLAVEDPLATRLIIRHRTQPSLDATSRFINGLFDPVVFVMEHRMLAGIRDHAEK